MSNIVVPLVQSSNRSGTVPEQYVDRDQVNAALQAVGTILAEHYMVLEYADDGLIDIAPGAAALTKNSGAQNMTLLAPAPDGDDGKKLFIISFTAQPHVVLCPPNTLNGANSTITFGGAIGDNIELFAYQGLWLVKAGIHTTLS